MGNVAKSFFDYGFDDRCRNYIDKLFTIDAYNMSAIILQMYLENKVHNVEAFANSSTLTIDKEWLSEKLANMSRIDANLLINLLSAREQKLLERKDFNQAYDIFSFVIKYDFESRPEFLKINESSLYEISKQNVAFADLLITAISQTSETRLKYLLDVAKICYDSKHFNKSIHYYNLAKDLEKKQLQSSNGKTVVRYALFL